MGKWHEQASLRKHEIAHQHIKRLNLISKQYDANLKKKEP